MAKEWAKAFYNNSRWLKCRAAYIAERVAIDGGLCETCGEELGFIVHHEIMLTPENINSDEAYSHEYMSYDCKRCHDRKEGHFVKGDVDVPRYRFGSDGQVLPPV